MINMKLSNSISTLIYILIILASTTSQWANCQSVNSNAHPEIAALVAESLPTVTVRGFLNFRTVVDGTVIVFTPASAAATTEHSEISSTSFPSIKPSKSSFTSSSQINIKPTLASKGYLESEITPTPTLHSSSDASSSKPVDLGGQYPTGLVTVLDGTVVLNGATTVHETKVFGTYINGKYAQILKSTSHVKSSDVKPTSLIQTSKIKPSATASYNPSLQTRTRSYLLKSESTSENAKHVRPVKVLEARKKEEESKETDAKSFNRQNNSMKLHRPTRIGTQLTYTPRENYRVRLNRFKVKVVDPSVASPNSREKVEEEAAKEINQRFQKRLGIIRPENRGANNPRRSRDEVRGDDQQSIGSNAKPVGVWSEFASGSYELPLFEQPNPIQGTIEPAIHSEQVGTVASQLNGSPIEVTKVDEQIHPSTRLFFEGDESALIKQTEPLPLTGNEVTEKLESQSIVISKVYSLTEHVSRTSVVPVYDGTSSANHTITESFEIRKVITAFKTVPPGDSALLATLSAEMANGTAFLDEIQTCKRNPEPSLPKIAIEATKSSEDGLFPHCGPTPSPSSPDLRPLDSSPKLIKNENPHPSKNLSPFDLSNPLVLEALRNPALAALYLSLHGYNNQQVPRPFEHSPQQIANNFNPLAFEKPVSTVTHTYTTVTEATTTHSKIYTLKYNALSTKYRTVTSTSVYPTTITTTSTVIVNPTISEFNQFYG